MSVPRTANPNTQRCLQQARTSLAASMVNGVSSPSACAMPIAIAVLPANRGSLGLGVWGWESGVGWGWGGETRAERRDVG